MQVRVVFCPEVGGGAGVERLVTLPDGADVALLLAALRQDGPGAEVNSPSIAVSVNGEFVTPVHVLEEGDEVSITLPAQAAGD